MLKSISGAEFLISCVIISLIFLAKAIFMVCPGFFAITCPFMLFPINVKSPITSNSLCLAGSFWCLSSRLFKIPFSCTAIFSLLNVLANLASALSSTSLSTITIALFISPPFIKLFFSNSSNSCKKQNVRDEENLVSNSEISSKTLFCFCSVVEL